MEILFFHVLENHVRDETHRVDRCAYYELHRVGSIGLVERFPEPSALA